MKTVPPTTSEGIERYLGSGLVKGIGPILAKKLVGRFGAEVLAVIENRAAELQTVDGIGPKRRERIAHAWQEARQVREIMLFLHSHGVSTSRAVRIFKTYGEQAIEKVRSNPYVLAKDIYGIGFATADQIAQKVGIPKDSLNRARAGIDHVLLEATSDGHCALPLAKLKLAAAKLLEVPEGTVEQALSQMLTSGSLLLEEIDGEPLIFLPHLRRAEEGIAARIKSLAGTATAYPPIDLEKAVAWCERRTGKTLAPSQREALRTVLANRCRGHHGWPGRGQDDARELDPDDPACQGREVPAVRPDRTGGEAAHRDHGLGGEDDPPPAGNQPRNWAVRQQRVEPARLRPSGRGRDLDGGRAADALPCAGCSQPRRTDSGRRRGPASFGWSGHGAAGLDRERGRAGRATDRSVQAGGGQPNHHERAPHPPRSDAGHARERTRVPISISSSGTSRKRSPQRWSSWCRSGFHERFRLDPIRDVQVLCPMNRGSLGVRELNTALQRVLNPA